MNKEQREYFSSKFPSDHYGIVYITKTELEKRIVEYCEIDPTPDKPQYRIVTSHLRDINTASGESFLYEAGTKEEVYEKLLQILRRTPYREVETYVAGKYLKLHDGKYWKVKEV